jgi:hypothetical protein
MVKFLILRNENSERFHRIRRFAIYNNKETDCYIQETRKQGQRTETIFRDDLDKIIEFLGAI